mmetsp:Transcript_15501/g.31804  ORF Transcript_15501/g.31804 Transcript_15501/m.31804 type:complete len:94 (+) Transcript_15501:1373-1654(+)
MIDIGGAATAVGGCRISLINPALKPPPPKTIACRICRRDGQLLVSDDAGENASANVQKKQIAKTNLSMLRTIMAVIEVRVLKKVLRIKGTRTT